MGILATIVVGFLAGVLAKWLHPGKDSMGFILTTLLGIAGSIVASYLGQALHWYRAGEPASFIGSVLGAVLILVLYGQIARRNP